MAWSPEAESTVRRAMASHPPRNEWLRYQSYRLDALYVGSDLWSSWFLLPSGEVVIVGEDFDAPEVDSRYSDRLHALRAISGASRLYPELAVLLPAREVGAADCECVAHPQIFGAGRVICPDCGGVGWLPAERPA